MKILFVVDPLPKLKAYKDSSIAMMRALSKRGHVIAACGVDELAVLNSEAQAHARDLAVSDDNAHWYREDEAAWRSIADFDVVMMRKDPPFDMEYIYATYVLELAERAGVRVFNAPQKVRDLNEKMAILRFPEWIVPTLVTRATARLQGFIDEQRDVILKPLDGMGGTSIFRVRHDDPNRNVIVETLNRFGESSVMAQRFIPEIREGDKRVLVVGGEVVPYALARIPKSGETRGNLAAGGSGVAMPLTTREKSLAEALAPQLWAQGLLVVGLDVIGGYLTEVNVTSPTCFVEIAEQTGFDAAALLAEQLEKSFAAR